MLKRQSVMRVEESDSLMDAIHDNIETFISNVRRGKLGARDGRSFSTTAACETVQLMHNIVTLFREHEEQHDSVGNEMLRSNCPADVVATTQVRRLLWLISFAGEAVLRAQFGTLLLTNVTRRVLSFIRTAAVENTASTAELEAIAAQRLNRLGPGGDDEDEDEDSKEPQPHPQQQRQQTAQGQLSRSRGAPSAASPESALGSDDRVQRSFVLYHNGSVRFKVSSAELAGMVKQDGDDDDDDDDDDGGQTMDEILAIGIPGKQMLRRAPSRRELASAERDTEFPVRVSDVLDNVLERIETFQREIEGMCDELCNRASKQLHASDTVITMGCSNTTRHYLLRALAAGVTFKVIILEGAPWPASATHKLASELRGMQAEVQVLPDSSAFAVMGTCTKVLIGVENVLANGGLLAPIGTHPLCIAAKHFAVPVLVATTTLKMSPYYPRDVYCTSLVKISRTSAQEIPWNTYGSPGDVLQAPYGEKVENVGCFIVHSPVTEYVPPELITLYATNESEYTPSQIHRIVRENYNPED